MNALIQKLTADWHPMRIIKLVFGIWALVQAFQMHDYLIGLFGLFFLYQSITNTGCCGNQGCYKPPVHKTTNSNNFTEYEEIK